MKILQATTLTLLIGGSLALAAPGEASFRIAQAGYSGDTGTTSVQPNTGAPPATSVQPNTGSTYVPAVQPNTGGGTRATGTNTPAANRAQGITGANPPIRTNVNGTTVRQANPATTQTTSSAPQTTSQTTPNQTAVTSPARPNVTINNHFPAPGSSPAQVQAAPNHTDVKVNNQLPATAPVTLPNIDIDMPDVNLAVPAADAPETIERETVNNTYLTDANDREPRPNVWFYIGLFALASVFVGAAIVVMTRRRQVTVIEEDVY